MSFTDYCQDTITYLFSVSSQNLIGDCFSFIGIILNIVIFLFTVLALYITYRAFFLKSGESFQCAFGIMSTVSCEDDYISNVTIKNNKDKPLVVTAIYFRIGYNIYIEIENFADTKPIIIPAFEVYQKQYPQQIYYSSGIDTRLNINSLIRNRKVKRGIFLETINSKKSFIGKFFDNYYTAWIQIVRASLEGNEFYGDKVNYIISFTNNGNKQNIPIHERDYEVKIFKDFALTKESLNSKKNLEIFLNSQRAAGRISFDTMEVFDWQEILEKNYKLSSLKVIEESRCIGFFEYFIVGKVHTLYEKTINFISNKVYLTWINSGSKKVVYSFFKKVISFSRKRKKIDKK